MDSKAKEYLSLICNLYIAAIMGILPFYMKEGYWQLGDAKYVLFRNITLICLVLSVVVILYGLLICRISTEGDKLSWRHKWSMTDTFVAAYGALNIISWRLSSYQDTAFTGYEQWYMGLLSQLLFIWIYFFLSWFYDGDQKALWFGVGVFFIVSLLGILNRFTIDPLNLFAGWTIGDWNYAHLLSTIGNINWLCGYLCVMLPYGLTAYLYTDRKGIRAAAYVVSVTGLLLLCIQGSDSGLVVFAAACLILFLIAMDSEKSFRRVAILGCGMAVLFILLRGVLSIGDIWDAFPTDDKGRHLISWQGWPLVLVGILMLLWLSRRLAFSKIKKAAFLFICVAGLGIAFSLVFLFHGKMAFNYAWGSGRGGLWTLAVKSFQEGGILQKLFGVGPDCYGRYIYNTFPVEQYVVQDEMFRDVINVNAHNEWLNQLVNTGLLGLLAYTGIFISAFIRYYRRRKQEVFLHIGLMVLCLYGVNSIFSFQQVMNTPYLFLTLGLCESRYHKGALNI